jgi:predicted metalloprotease with PDZ domain
VLRKQSAGRAWWGDVRIEYRNGAPHIAAAPLANTPAYAAGLDLDDELQQVDGTRVGSGDDVSAALKRHKPGDRIDVVYVDRSRTAKKSVVTLAEDPGLELVALEAVGGTLTADQKVFRTQWLGSY